MKNCLIKNYFEREYTPFGYIQNPKHQSISAYRDVADGVIRTDDYYPGMGWFFPWSGKVYGKAPVSGWTLTAGIGLKYKGKLHLTRSDFEALGLYSGYHTANMFSYNLMAGGVEVEALYWLTVKSELIMRVKAAGSLPSGTGIYLVLHSSRTDGEVRFSFGSGSNIGMKTDASPEFKFPEMLFASNSMAGKYYESDTLDGLKKNIAADKSSVGKEFGRKELFLVFELNIKNSSEALVNLGQNTGFVFDRTESGRIKKSLKAVVRDNEDFYRGLPVPDGDWPEYWKNGWIYDFETTRLCTLPPSGIFTDYWPTWMLQWPRIVLAEGTFDMNRFGYADIEKAKRAVLTIFRDTPYDNCPCVFSSGAFNMVAKDGEKCGTSIAWVMPYYNIYELYLRCLDKDWALKLYPYMKDCILWWLENRTDSEGWAVYKCTWESGEDNNPRIDPMQTGNSVIFDNVRPVELQACMAHSAHILLRFCEELGIEEDKEFWKTIKKRYSGKLQQLWDKKKRRFRDWNKATGGFIEEKGVRDYWGEDFTRFSPLSLSSVQFDMISDSQLESMKREIACFGNPPFTVWPSWNYVAMEAATKTGLFEFASETAYSVIDRVYRENDRRDLSVPFPLPGNAREYWPLTMNDFFGNNVYAWGAQTSTLLIRQIMGIRSSENTGDCIFKIAPSIPEKLFIPGKKYGLCNFGYRGLSFDISYGIIKGGKVSVSLVFKTPVKIEVISGGKHVCRMGKYGTLHKFSARNFTDYEVIIK